MIKLRVRQHLLHRPVRRAWHASFIKRGLTVRRAQRRGPGLQKVHEGAPVVAPIGIAGEARIGHPLRVARGKAETLEGLFTGDRWHDKSVRRPHRAKHRPAWRCDGKLGSLHLNDHQCQHRLQHRHIDVLTQPRLLALSQSGHGGGKGIRSGDDVGDIDCRSCLAVRGRADKPDAPCRSPRRRGSPARRPQGPTMDRFDHSRKSSSR
jgi:hypothetical protein